ncbi:MAG TPA: prephenate dehydrogenase/arogenate dehydrogenase family protein [Acidobacteriaceae bacterium]|nr:prephenate dehydrogenase/arogenate dehydrogenase family protein [Acidobacteriaceae bacterium]
MPTRILILGTGLIGASLGLALKVLVPNFSGTILGWDTNPAELQAALELGALDQALPNAEAVITPNGADVYVLATPVLPILDWLQRLAPALKPGQLVTDVGSTKRDIVQLATALYNGPGQATFLPSHPMAGKESSGAALADPALFRGAAWLFTPVRGSDTPQTRQWRSWIEDLGAHTHDIDADEHDRLCAWVSHLPQMLSTALAALLEDSFAADPRGREIMDAIGGRALRETTRLGASPYSMWRDIALTNTDPIAATLHALEQKLAHLRENLRTPELREEFTQANRFRSR